MVRDILNWWEILRYPHPLNPKKESLPYLIQPNGSLLGKSSIVHHLDVPEHLFGVIPKETSQEIRVRLFNTMVLHQNIVSKSGVVLVYDIPGKVSRIANQMKGNRFRYERVSHRFSNPIRWYHVALLHLMECNLSFNHYLGNGQPLNQRTTIVPKGRGPFKTWEDGAVDAIIQQKLDLVRDWSVGNTLEMLERFNGWGYVLHHPTVNSPYLWSGTNHYTIGKYTVDGKFDKNVVSTQIGIAPILKVLLAEGT